MSEKNAIIKRDSYNNWVKSFGKYIPVKNVIIIMDKDDGSIELRIGDGQTYIENLPNLISDNKLKSNSPKHTVENAVLSL